MAAWASWQRALRLDPENRAATEALDILSVAPDLPHPAGASHRFRSPVDEARRLRWSDAFRGEDLADLDRAAIAFSVFAEEDENDDAAFYNLALCLAWSGRNLPAIEALDASVRAGVGRDFNAAVEAWTLAEILRQGGGAEILADDLDHNLMIPWDSNQDGDPFEKIAQIAVIRPVPIPIDPRTGEEFLQGARIVEWLDRPIPASPFEITRPSEIPRVLATVLSLPGRLLMTSPSREGLERVERLFSPELGGRTLDRISSPLPIRLMDAEVWLGRLPAPQYENGDEVEETSTALAMLRRAAIEEYFENLWIKRPRIGLSGGEDAPGPLAPVEAARLARDGDLVARAKLTAIVGFREQLAIRPRVISLYEGYPFDRLRRRLGLTVRDENAIDTREIGSMSEAELTDLDPTKLELADLSDAESSAHAVCPPEVTLRFTAELRRRSEAREAPQDCQS